MKEINQDNHKTCYELGSMFEKLIFYPHDDL